MARTFPEFERCFKLHFPQKSRGQRREDGPGACWEMECGDGSEFVYEGKREEAVEPPAFSLGCGPSYSYTVAVKRRESSAVGLSVGLRLHSHGSPSPVTLISLNCL